MKIGIDAKWFFEGPPSGRVVVQNLVRQIIYSNTDNELYIFLDKKHERESFPYENARVHLKYVWANNNLLSNILLIPFIAYPLHLDIIIFQNFAPVFSNFKRYSFVHDVIFKSHPEYYTAVERLYFLPLRLLTRLSHGLCTVSEAEKQRMIQYGYCAADAIDVVYHGADESFMPATQQNSTFLDEVRKKYSLPNRYLLYVGRLNVRKNIFNLLRAISLLRHDIPLVIVGGYDWKMTNVDDLIEKLGIMNRLVFTGPVFGKGLAAIYGMAHLFCFPSYEESFGLPALEGMASGVPVVVSDRSSLPEICGDSGNYVNPDSPENIAEVIDGLLDDDNLRERKQTMGLARAQQFKWEISARNLMQYASNVVLKG
jgi:glycosyltransferase involved in cell wall biosynthesis